MKLSALYSSRPSKRLRFGSTQFGNEEPLHSVADKKFKTPKHKGRSIMGFKRNRPVA